jgi:hypothetical protein
LGLKRKYICICWKKFSHQQNHRVILKLVMLLEQTLKVTITDIVDIVWLKQTNVIHLTCYLTFSEFTVTTNVKSEHSNLTHVGKVRNSPFYSLPGEKFCSCDSLVYLFWGHLQNSELNIKNEEMKICLRLPLKLTKVLNNWAIA